MTPVATIVSVTARVAPLATGGAGEFRLEAQAGTFEAHGLDLLRIRTP